MLFTAVSALALAAVAVADTVSVTPHDSYSSSIGVLGCKVNVNRVAYFPTVPDCDNLCVQVTYQGRSVNLLRIDHSGGAHDISYDAWNYLSTGKNATVNPTQGGGISMQYTNVPMSQCASLIGTAGGKLPLEAANSMNFLASCLAKPSSWVAKNHVLFNIANSACTYGINEQCTLNMAVSNQPSCPHQLGLQTALTGLPVYNIQYGTGKEVLATQ